MAFVSIDNPAGILHHGGQMAWDAVSDTRVVMLTFTKDYKALIQEINYVEGAPVVGVPSFVAAVAAAGLTAKHHLRPKIKSIAGTNLVFAMVPSAFAYASNYNRQYQVTGSAAAFSWLGSASRMPMPIEYTGYILERDASGRYTVKSSSQVLMPETSGDPYIHLNSIYIEYATPTAIRVRRPGFRNSYKVVPVQNSDATLNGSVLSTFTVSTTATLYSAPGVTNAIWACYDAKRVRDVKGRYKTVEAIAGVTSSFESNSQRTVSTGLYETGNYRVLPLLRRGATPSNVSIGDNYSLYSSPASTVLIDADINEKAYYSTGHTVAGQNTLMASTDFNYLAGTTPVFCPLDTGFVHSSGIICVVGGQSDPTGLAVFDADLAYSLDFGSNGNIVPLRLSFRQITGIGHYAGPYDPITTPYYYGQLQNNNQILHKVNDTQFWLIGCFMDSPTGDAKIGVISVSPPA